MENRGSVKGVLRDSGGRPVADAIVMITAGDAEFNEMASVSNETGEFFLSNIVIPGNYTLQVQHGEGTVQKNIAVSSAGDIISIVL